MEIKRMTLEDELNLLNSDKESDIRRYFGMQLNKAEITKELHHKVRKHMLECGMKSEDYEIAVSDVLANEPELRRAYYELVIK